MFTAENSILGAIIYGKILLLSTMFVVDIKLLSD